MNKYDLQKEAIIEASLSKCTDRKVGAIIADGKTIIARGHNYKGQDECVHAEIACLDNAEYSLEDLVKCTIYVTQPPCNDCLKAIKEAKLELILVDEFMKFDDTKLRYDLIPPSSIKGLAEVLTYGAKKYKPNNWQNNKDLHRFEGAMFRHFEAYRKGEKFDPETGLHHLKHLMTNATFIIELEEAKLEKRKPYRR